MTYKPSYLSHIHIDLQQGTTRYEPQARPQQARGEKHRQVDW